MYSIPDYVAMIRDTARVDAYARAMHSVITPESFVLEIGTGIGAFAVMASQMGARRVVAVEPDDSIAVARMLARDNGTTRVEFIQGLSTDLELPEKPDVIVSDLRGMLPMSNGHVQSIIDARERLLAPNGALIPVADTLFAAVVELPADHRYRVSGPQPVRDVRLNVLNRFLTNYWMRVNFTPDQMFTKPGAWAMLDYRHVRSHDVSGSTRLTVTRDGVAHGLAVWFDATVLEGITFSNAPGRKESIYGTAFFPWANEVALSAGDEIGVRIEASHVGDDYIWRWFTTIVDPDDSPTAKAEFDQSTFHAAPLVAARLAKRTAARRSVLNDEGEIERFILDAMDGHTSNEQIAQDLQERFPKRFRRLNDALGRVGSVAQRFTRD